MTNKMLSRLTFLVALLLLVLFGRNLIGRYQSQRPNEYQNSIKGLKSDDIVRIEVGRNDQILVITREGTGWKVASKSADTAKVNELIGSLIPKQSPQLLSENKEKFADLSLDPASAVTVKLITQAHEYQFAVGKQIDTLTAVQSGGLEKVYGLSYVPALAITGEEWFDMTVVDIDSLQVKQLAFKGRDEYILIQTADSQWAFDGSADQANSDGINTFMYKFNPLKAESLASTEQVGQFDLLSSGFFITLTDKADNKTELQFKKMDDEYIVRRSSDNEYFILSTSSGESFEKSRESFTSPSN